MFAQVLKRKKSQASLCGNTKEEPLESIERFSESTKEMEVQRKESTEPNNCKASFNYKHLQLGLKAGLIHTTQSDAEERRAVLRKASRRA